MKSIIKFAFLFVVAAGAYACVAKKGCPSNGKAIGAEKLASGGPKEAKEAKKAPKYKLGKLPS